MNNIAHRLILGPIIGGLSHQSVNLWARADGEGTLHAFLGQQPDLSDAQPAGTSPLQAENGFAGVVPIRNLQPETTYYYALTLSPDLPQGERFPSFTTFPPPGEPRSFNFVFGSCFRPTTEHSGQAFRAIIRRLETDDLRFLLMIGDQIYADQWKYNGIGKVATTLEDYRAVYAHVWSNPPLRDLLSRLPAFMILDDHEVDDDWHWLDSERQWADIPILDKFIRWIEGRPPQERQLPPQRVRYALQAYWEHQGMHAPPMLHPPRLNRGGLYTLETKDTGSLAYTFTFGAAAFFVMDTRTMRVRGRGAQTMLGEEQWAALEEWLLNVKDTYPIKFLVTSSALLFTMFVDVARDRWSGYPRERDRLLHFLAANGIEGVYLLAGDLHSAHAVSAELYGPNQKAIPLWEFCASPFEQNPNWLSRFTYIPILSGAVHHQRKHFCVSAINYGLVRVDFSEPHAPRVRFEIHYLDERKGEWKMRAVG
ncbi:MAG: hypothetical protein D6770_03065 [Anaerolineae bacterium]|nr:MAG: hypothetical protein D6770_03065 [Anaerolineae bacterium]